MTREEALELAREILTEAQSGGPLEPRLDAVADIVFDAFEVERAAWERDAPDAEPA